MKRLKFLPGLAIPLLFLSSCGRTESEAPKASTQTTAVYQLGTKLDFGTGGNAKVYEVSGWSTAEPGFTWSDKSTASLAFKIDGASGPLQLRARLNGFMKMPELPAQSVELSANGQKIADWEVGEETEMVATVPAKAVSADGILRIDFKMPKAVSPKSLGGSDDSRTLGIALRSLELTKG